MRILIIISLVIALAVIACGSSASSNTGTGGTGTSTLIELGTLVLGTNPDKYGFLDNIGDIDRYRFSISQGLYVHMQVGNSSDTGQTNFCVYLKDSGNNIIDEDTDRAGDCYVYTWCEPGIYTFECELMEDTQHGYLLEIWTTD